jgi:hypothetical protein
MSHGKTKSGSQGPHLWFPKLNEKKKLKIQYFLKEIVITIWIFSKIKKKVGLNHF